jgi:hypothetical protein
VWSREDVGYSVSATARLESSDRAWTAHAVKELAGALLRLGELLDRFGRGDDRRWWFDLDGRALREDAVEVDPADTDATADADGWKRARSCSRVAVRRRGRALISAKLTVRPTADRVSPPRRFRQQGPTTCGSDRTTQRSRPSACGRARR